MSMSEWKVSELCQIIGGGTPKTSVPEYWDGDICWLSVKDFSGDRRYVYESEKKITELGLNNSSTKLLQKDDIIISARGTVGEMAMIPFPMAFNQSCFGLRGNEKVDKTFLFYLLKTKIKTLKKQANGAVFDTINISTFNNIGCTIPPLETQKKIANLLSEIDDKIENNRKICANLEAQAQALFKHWFIDFAPFKDGKFVESELGMIPEGWRVGKLGDVSSFISRGLSPKYQPGTNEMVLGQTCVRNNVVTLDNAREHNPKQNTDKRVQKWDVLLNSTGIGSLGRVGVVYFDDNNVCFDSHLTVVRSRQESFRYYLGRNLLSRQKEIENMAVGSTGQTELPKKDVLVMPILIPTDCSLASFNILIDDIGNEMYSLLQENRRLSSLRDTLLPKLMSGEIKL